MRISDWSSDVCSSDLLTPWQALSAATRTPGEFIAKTVPGAAKFGVVAPGYRAELLLVADNQLDKPATSRTPLGVRAGGRWCAAAELTATPADAAGKRGASHSAAFPPLCPSLILSRSLFSH